MLSVVRGFSQTQATVDLALERGAITTACGSLEEACAGAEAAGAAPGRGRRSGIPWNRATLWRRRGRARDLVRVEERKAGGFRKFDEVRREIERLLQEQDRDERFRQWSKQLKEKAYIDIRI